MLAELARREKAANIKPDPDIDIYMKVRGCFARKIVKESTQEESFIHMLKWTVILEIP